ncbi:ParB N-terminal domain-containing protein, partial [Roseomonas mucosa]|uniref:hypothetical protein n=1 Tax=Roseomonas mucosa TaxID=207340 RepID=UPI001EF54E73
LQGLSDLAAGDVCPYGGVRSRKLRLAVKLARSPNNVTMPRCLLRDEMPLGSRFYGGKREDLVEWKNNTLGPRSTSLTTIGVIYETVKLVLEDKRVPKLNIQERPDDADVERYTDLTAEVWKTVLEGMDAYQAALADPKKIPAMRKDDADTSLLFKPAAQIALFDGLLRARAAGLTLEEAVARANRLRIWSMGEGLWKGLIIKAGGTIDAAADARERMALLVSYLIAADRLGGKEKASIWKRFTEARLDDSEDLPPPIAGNAYTAAEAKAFFDAQERKVA